MMFTADEKKNTRDEWCTPLWLFEYLSERFGPFQADAAATTENKIAPYIPGPHNPWPDRTFCNPPFSDFPAWVDAAIDSCGGGRQSVIITLANTSAKYFQRLLAEPYAQLLVPNVRIAFVDPTDAGRQRPGRDTVVWALGYGPSKTEILDLRSVMPRKEKK